MCTARPRPAFSVSSTLESRIKERLLRGRWWPSVRWRRWMSVRQAGSRLETLYGETAATIVADETIVRACVKRQIARTDRCDGPIIVSTFYRSMLCISAAHAVVRCLSVWLDVCLSRSCIVSKRLKIRPWLLWNTNRKPYPCFRMVPFSITFSDL